MVQKDENKTKNTKEFLVNQRTCRKGQINLLDESVCYNVHFDSKRK